MLTDLPVHQGKSSLTDGLQRVRFGDNVIHGVAKLF